MFGKLRRDGLDPMTEYRASFDATVSFSNGGELSARGFRIDVPSADVDEDALGELFVASLGLLMTDSVKLSNVDVFPEPHKGTRGEPSDRKRGPAPATGRLVELSHMIKAGMVTYPGLPAPEITPHITRAASRARYAAGTEFAFDRLTLLGNTGTYLDTPFHRYADGADLSETTLAQTADLPTIVVRVQGAKRVVDVGELAALDVRGCAVLLHTGDDTHFGSPRYAQDPHYLTKGGAVWLADHGAVLVGTDSVNIDDFSDGERPAHTVLLAAGIPVVEHLTGLGQLPPTGAFFTAAPLRIHGFGTIPVRAFARVPE